MTRTSAVCTFTTMDVDELEWAVRETVDGWQSVGPDGVTGPVRPTVAEVVATDLPEDLVRSDRGLMVDASGADLLEVVRALRCPVGPGGFDLDAVAEGWSTSDVIEWVEGLPVAHADDTVVQVSTVVTDAGPCLAVWPLDGSAAGVLVVFDEDRGGVAPDVNHLSAGWWCADSMPVSSGATELGACGPHVWVEFEWSDSDAATTWLEYVPDGTAGAPRRVADALRGSLHVYLRTTVGFPARADEVDDAGEPEVGTSRRVHGEAWFRQEVFNLVCAEPGAARVVAALRDPGSPDGRRVDEALGRFLADDPTLDAVDAVLAELLGWQTGV